MSKKDFLSLSPLTPEHMHRLLDLSAQVKARPQDYRTALQGLTLGMIFEKSSTRTRVSFEVGMHQLGGHAIFLSSADLQLGRGETIEDTARVLSRYVQAIMCRTFEQRRVELLARHATVPVINGLSDSHHPCQALADYLTIQERFGHTAGVRLTYLGDGNNVAHSLIEGAALLGVQLTLACPQGFQPDMNLLQQARQRATATGATIRLEPDPIAAATGADALYTDVWVSMGQEKARDAQETRRLFEPYRVDADLLKKAAPHAIFLHCLPAHRGDEVTDEVADHERSAILDQAENRMHTEKALLLDLLAPAAVQP